MKIVSKYKDFYDYIVQDHDADIIYVRNIGLVNEYYDKLFAKEDNYLDNYSPYYRYFDRQKANGHLEFHNFIFGIYPYVYAQPILRIYYRSLGCNIIESIFMILSKEMVNNLLSDDEKISKEAYNELINNAQIKFNELVDNYKCKEAKVSFAKQNTLNDVKKSLSHYVYKVECKEIFYKMNAPIFVKNYNDLFDHSVYHNTVYNTPIFGKSKDIYYITNISFQRLNYNILKYWYNELNDLNTYINIENFLWSVKQEPEAKPDNKTKILSHGFDLKTSFRKM